MSGTESTARLYACPNILTQVNIVHADRNTPGFMRAPGRALHVRETDDAVNPLGIKGLGEIGIVGVNAAVANAVHHATGWQVRSLPIRVEDLLG